MAHGGGLKRGADGLRLIMMCEVPSKGASKAKRDTYSESAAKLFEVYVRYTREGQRPVVSRQTFRNRMAGLGYPVDKKEDANYYPVRLRLDGKSSET